VNYALRVLLRLITLVLSISIVVVVLAGSFWYVWQDAKGRAPEVGYTVTMKRVEHAALGLYLRYKGAAATQPANPKDAQEVTFVIKSGETVTKVAENLQRRGLIREAKLFGYVVRYAGDDSDVQAGVYVLRPNMSMEEIVRQFQHGRIAATQVTIPEGWRAEEIAALLETAGVTSSAGFLTAVAEGSTDYAFLGDRPAGSPASLEGFLFPDTYQFPLKTSPERVLEIMLQNFDRRVPPELRRKAALQDLTLYEALKLASIIEREAMVAEERPVIAGVYLNRIRKGMYLQADATVQYAKGFSSTTKRWWNPTTVEESQKIVSPYNTYLNPGLPPGPICNPGLSAIQAALEPTTTDYLYYYAKGDGSHAFATTYEEQLRNQELYGGQKK
jgi:UPF0755 protein